ncbi:hypothetical protein Patl1_04341 [Pistacia atlantica]|uniref:Uncharacterized protein n=1 Tax=Pistacia atlantica TaxID=434234 RepID=A0ACC1BVN9_9ROSI|nr:hypothetical protein Patl1_04341 [Pistacia atlantica]
MATVIATFTFTAAFTIPRGLKNDSPNKGMATLIRKRGFQAFAIMNTMAMTTSMTAVVLVIAYFFYSYSSADTPGDTNDFATLPQS